jgi:phosphate-selective porin OprO/OprP
MSKSLQVAVTSVAWLLVGFSAAKADIVPPVTAVPPSAAVDQPLPADSPAAPPAGSQASVLPPVSDPREVVGSDWDESSDGVTGELGFARLAQAPVAPPGGNDLDSLRRELREAVGQLNFTRQELQQTRDGLIRQQLSTENGPADGGQRLSRLETAFDAFRRQLSAEGPGSYPSARLTGFTQLDDYSLFQDPKNKATVGTGQNGVGFRRARVAIVGNVAEFTSYMVEVDFASAGRPSFYDVWAEQDNLPMLGAVRAGQFLQPFSVDAMSGFRNLPFLERSLPFTAFVPFRRVGAMAANASADQRTYWAYSVFKTGGYNGAPLGDSRFATDIGNQGGYSFSTRITHLMYYDEPANDRYLWDVGISYDFSAMTAAPGSTAGAPSVPFYQSRTGPEFGPLGDGLDTAPATFGPVSYAGANITPPNYIDTGRYQASSFNLIGAETVYQSGPLSFQSEFMATEVNSVVGPIWYTGAYGEVMYRLTGEHRGYDKRLASLKNVTPYTEFISLRHRGIAGWGAFEVAGRLSYVDLRNPASLTGHYLSSTNNSGNGTLTDTTLGVTWWLNAHTKLQANWIHAMLDNTSTVAHTTSGYSQADFLVTRLQIDF